MSPAELAPFTLDGGRRLVCLTCGGPARVSWNRNAQRWAVYCGEHLLSEEVTLPWAWLDDLAPPSGPPS